MASPRKTRRSHQITSEQIDAAKNDLQIHFTPRNQAQSQCLELWPRCRIMFLVGEAGGGKTHAALALSLIELLGMESSRKPRLIVTRPMIPVDEEIGFLPGTIEEKLAPWLAPLTDVFGEMSFQKWEKIQSCLELEKVPIGMLRGRTIRNGCLILDEAQELTANQIKCALTRIGHGGRIIFCGDESQSSKFTMKNSPLMQAASKLDGLDTVCTIRFTPQDQVRDPLITEILRRLV